MTIIEEVLWLNVWFFFCREALHPAITDPLNAGHCLAHVVEELMMRIFVNHPVQSLTYCRHHVHVSVFASQTPSR